MLTKYDYLVQLEYLSMVYGQLFHTNETRLTMNNYFVALRLSMVYGLFLHSYETRMTNYNYFGTFLWSMVQTPNNCDQV